MHLSRLTMVRTNNAGEVFVIQIGGVYFPDGERHFQTFADDIDGYQKPQRDAALKYVKDWRRAMDLGANVGIFSRHFAKHFEEVLSVEPLEANIECLKLNLPENCKIVPYAIGDRNVRQKMYQTPKSLGGAFIMDDPDVDAPPVVINQDLVVEVDMITVDSMNLDSLGLFKLDIQGSEVIALKGARETILKYRPVVLIEEKPVGGPTGSVDHIKLAMEHLLSLGLVAKERVGADRVYVFE